MALGLLGGRASRRYAFIVLFLLIGLNVYYLSSVSLSSFSSVNDVDYSLWFDRQSPAMSDRVNLIIVPSHAVLLKLDATSMSPSSPSLPPPSPAQLASLYDESNWFLLDYQRGQLATFLSHIDHALTLAAADPRSILVFSGGVTREQAGYLSEGQSYYWAARMLCLHRIALLDAAGEGANYSTSTIHLDPISESTRLLLQESLPSADLDASRLTRASFERVLATSLHAEDFARDSYENLLFSLARFRELSGNLPHHVTVIGLAIKMGRFSDLHRDAIGYPRSRFAYVGIDPQGISEADRTRMREGEQTQSVAKFERDPYACGKDLAGKRAGRNPMRRMHGYLSSCPELVGLLMHCGPGRFPGADRVWAGLPRM